MTSKHARNGALQLRGRTQAPHARLRGSVLSLPRRGQRGFSLVELAVSFSLFLILASVISLALARSFSTATVVRSRTAVSAALNTELGKLAQVPYQNLTSGAFSVPDSCPNAPTGIAGTSCVANGTQRVVIAYGFQTDPTSTTCSATTDPTKYAAQNNAIVLCAALSAIGQSAFSSSNGVSAIAAAIATRQVNAPRPGFTPGSGTLRVQLTGNYTDLPSHQVFLVHPASVDSQGNVTGATQVGAGIVDSGSGIANITLPETSPGSHQTACTTGTPCALALSVGGTPTETLGANGPIGLLDSVSAGAGAAFAVPADAVTQVSARVGPLTSLTINLLAHKAGSPDTANPVPGSVCLWVTFPDVTGQRSVPVCNTGNAASIVLNGYEPNWATFDRVSASALPGRLAASSQRPRWPFPTGVPLRITLDNPNGTCPYAPGMVGSVPTDTSQLAGAPSGWAPRAVCSSYTWGIPSRLDVPTSSGGTTPVAFTSRGAWVTLDPNTSGSANLVWDNPMLAPGVVGYGSDQMWAKPRYALNCSVDESCTSAFTNRAANVLAPGVSYPDPTHPSASCITDGSCRAGVTAVSPEVNDCPQQYCFSTVHAKPYLSSPASSTLQLTGAGPTYTFHLQVRDTDDPASAITTPTWVAPSQTTFTLAPTSPQPGGLDGHTVDYTATFTDSTSGSALKDIQLTLSSGSPAVTNKVDLGLYYTGGAWTITSGPVSAAQGASNVAFTAHVTGTDGNAYPNALVHFSSTASGVSIADATTDSSGNATTQLNVPAGVAAGSYTITASIDQTNRSVSIPLTVTPTATGVALTLTSATVPEGGSTTVKASVTDSAGGPIPDTAVSLVAYSGSAVANGVYPAATGCVTDSSGQCSVTVVADPTAAAGGYTISGSAGSLIAPSQNLTVTPVPSRVSTPTTPIVARGQTLPGVTATLLDGAGSPISGASVSVTGPAGVTVNPATATTGSDGSFVIALTADPAAATGGANVTVVSGGKTLQLPITVAGSVGGVQAVPAYVQQGTSGPLTVNATDANSQPVANATITFSLPVAGVSYPATAVTGANGDATITLTVDPSVAANTYTGTASYSRSGTTTVGNISFTVTPRPSSVSVSGPAAQGATSTVTLVPTDTAGNPVPNAPLTLSGYPAAWTVNAPASTDSNGNAVVTITDSGSPAGSYPVTVNVGGSSIGIAIPLVATPGQITVTPNPLTVSAGTSVTANISVLDRSGAVYPNGALSFSGNTDFTSIAAPATLDSNGNAALTLTAGQNVFGGLAALNITVDSLTAIVPLQIKGAFSVRELAAGASLLLPLSDPDATARDLLGAHAGTYNGAGIKHQLPTPIGGAAASSFSPLDSGGNPNIANAATVQVPDPAQSLLPATGSFTVSAWVKPNSLAGIRTGFVLSKGNPLSATPGIQIGASSSSTSLRVSISDGTATQDSYIPLDAGYQPSNWVGTWTHLIVSVNRSAQVVTVYVNGVAQSTTLPLTGVTGSLASTAPLTIGSANGVVFDGAMTELAVFPTAFAASDATSLYQSSLALSYPSGVQQRSPVGYWRLNDAPPVTAGATVGAAGSYSGQVAVSNSTQAFVGGSGIDFSGGGYASLPTGSLAGTTSAASGVLWFRPTAGSTSGADGLLSLAGNGSYSLLWGDGTNPGTSVVTLTAGATTLTSPTALTLNAWHQIAFTTDGSTLNLYIDGNLAVSAAGAGNSPIAATATVAQQPTTAGPVNGLPGAVAEVQLYNTTLDAGLIGSDYSGAGTQ